MVEAVIEKRLEERRKALARARLFVDCVKKVLKEKVTAIVFGSFARGDFSEGSDIDLLIIVKGSLPVKPHDRIDLVIKCLSQYPEIEPVIITLEELKERYRERNPLIIEAIEQGVCVLDELKVKKTGF